MNQLNRGEEAEVKSEVLRSLRGPPELYLYSSKSEYYFWSTGQTRCFRVSESKD